MDTHEVYPHAPLALVAVEVRFPGNALGEATALPPSAQRTFRGILGDQWVLDPVKRQNVLVTFNSAGMVENKSQSVTLPRFTTRDRTSAVAVTDTSVTIETTSYRHYPEFRRVLEAVFRATGDVLAPDGVARLGMRYIDEIQVSELVEGHPAAWREWLHPSLVPPAFTCGESGELGPTGWQCTVQYPCSPEDNLVLRYGPRSDPLINPNSLLKRSRVLSPGSLFVLDFDSYWEPATIPEFDADALVIACDRLRLPIRRMFDLLVTDRLVGEFRKERPDD
jgi:uncharacterized protein (TIGR04255 family)